MRVTLIAAVARNGVIGGRGGKIPWHLPADSRHFRNYVRGKYLLLGRTTFEEMTGWFRDETPIVLSRRGGIDGGFLTASSVGEAVTLAKKSGAAELVVCGGASVYASVIDFADAMVLTHLDEEFEGGAVFPDFKESEWCVERRLYRKKDEENVCGMEIVWYQRRIALPSGGDAGDDSSEL